MAALIQPDLPIARGYVASGDEIQLAKRLLADNPWFFEKRSIIFHDWSQALLSTMDFTNSACLFLVGSGATGFSLAPEKAGAHFRGLTTKPKPSDLDFALVDPQFFAVSWNSMIAEDTIYGSLRRHDDIRIRIYWGRIEQDVVPSKHRSRLRKLVDAIRRDSACRGFPTTVRVYRRREDLLGYSRWCLRQLRKAVRE